MTFSVACGPTIQDQPTGGAAATSTTSAAGGAAGTGGATPTCTPGANIPCYDGPAGTEGVGLCASGTKTCAADGATFGACVGQVTPKVEDCSTPADDDCKGSAPECGTHLWSQRFGDADGDYVSSIATDASGNIVIAGRFTGTIDLGGVSLSSPDPTYRAGLVAKFDPEGKVLWAKRLFDANGSSADPIASVDATGAVVVVGAMGAQMELDGLVLPPKTSSDIFIAKYDAQGKALWATQLGGTGAYFHRVAVGPNGDVGVCGAFTGLLMAEGKMIGSQGGLDAWVMKLAPDGQIGYVKTFGGPANDNLCSDLAVGPGGRVALTGELTAPVDFGGGTLPMVTAHDIHVAMLEPDGQHAWSKSFGAGWGMSIAFDSAGSVVVACSAPDGSGVPDFGGGPVTAGGSDRELVFAKLDENGKHLWSRGVSGAGVDDVRVAIAIDPTGDVVVSGNSTAGFLDFGGGPVSLAYAAKLGPKGAHRWSRGFDHLGSPHIDYVAADPSGHVVVAGDFYGNINLGGAPLSSNQGSPDILLAKLAP